VVMTDTQNTKTVRSEAPVAAFAFGIIALVTAFVFSTPGFPLIAGLVALLAGLAVIVKAQHAGTGQNWMAIAGVILAIVGIFISLVTYG
jgi:hypothetical protein